MDGQLAALERFCAAEGFEVVGSFVDVASDLGLQAKPDRQKTKTADESMAYRICGGDGGNLQSPPSANISC